jgi:hypothetical protein
MEAICCSETSVDTQRTTLRYIPDDGTLHNQRCENLKSYKKHISLRYKVQPVNGVQGNTRKPYETQIHSVSRMQSFSTLKQMVHIALAGFKKITLGITVRFYILTEVTMKSSILYSEM